MTRLYISFILLLSFTVSVHAQLYFESGVNDSKFSEYRNLSGDKTTLHSYDGLRDMSFGFGYIFPIKQLGEIFPDSDNNKGRSTFDQEPNLLRFGVGIGFDQMNLSTKAVINNLQRSVDYNMGQVQGRLTAYLTPTLIKHRNPDYLGIRRPAVKLNLEGGLSYNYYTNAVRSYNSNGGAVSNLRDNNEFVDSYPAFTMAAGLVFPLNRYTSIYGKFEVENAFSLTENNQTENGADAEERYSMVKRRVMLGLRLDFRLKNKLEEQKRQYIEELASRKLEYDPTDDLEPLHRRLDSLERALEAAQKTNIVDNRVYVTELRQKDNDQLSNLKHVLFPLNSSYFDQEKYRDQLTDIVALMLQNPTLKVKLIGYADSKTGSQRKNLALSEKRAKRVYDHLIKLGAPAEQLFHVGAGQTLQFGTDPLTQNRRTEIIIVRQ